jgi:hypothetical protein
MSARPPRELIWPGGWKELDGEKEKDRFGRSGRAHLVHGVLIQIRDQIPQDVAVWSLDEDCALADAELSKRTA